MKTFMHSSLAACDIDGLILFLSFFIIDDVACFDVSEREREKDRDRQRDRDREKEKERER